MQNIVPRLLQFALNGTEYAIATFPDFVTFPVPVTAGIPSRPAQAGDTLIFYAIGLGQTNPPVTGGRAGIDSDKCPERGHGVRTERIAGSQRLRHAVVLRADSRLRRIVPGERYGADGDSERCRGADYLAIGSVTSNAVAIAVQ